MDTLTHLALGACTGELILGKRLGKRAMFWGAVAANIPDCDIAGGWFLPGDQSLVFHRGITHSFMFALLFGLLLAIIARRLRPNIGLGAFAFFFCFEIALHDLLDTCTSYGTGLLEPFTHARYSIHLLYVADPLFTVSLLVAALYLLWGKGNRVKWASIALTITGLYVCIAACCKAYVDSRTTAAFTTPAPFTTLLWFGVEKTGKGYNTCYISVFDKSPVTYGFHPQNDSLLKQPEPYLKTFSNGFYTISERDGQLYFNVLRFGQVQGWLNDNAGFALSYPLNSHDDQNMVVQKGRFAGWNPQTFKLYLERIGGE
jgi:inner membrane protein